MGQPWCIMGVYAELWVMSRAQILIHYVNELISVSDNQQEKSLNSDLDTVLYIYIKSQNKN